MCWPEGGTLRQSEAVARRFEAGMTQESVVATVTGWVGNGVLRFYLPLNQIFLQPNVKSIAQASRTG